MIIVVIYYSRHIKIMSILFYGFNIKAMNEVSVIINGVRYDAVEEECANCSQCDLHKDCDEQTFQTFCNSFTPLCIFRKSDKKFEL
jgi:predicted YcjX-like family ATPase